MIERNGIEIRSREEFAAWVKGKRKRIQTRAMDDWQRCMSCSRQLGGRRIVRWGAGYTCAEDCAAARNAITKGRMEAQAQALKNRRSAYTVTLMADVGGFRIAVMRDSTGEVLGLGALHKQLGRVGQKFDGRYWSGGCALEALGQAEHSLMRAGSDSLWGDDGWVRIEWAEWAQIRNGGEYNGFTAADVAELEELLERAEEASAVLSG